MKKKSCFFWLFIYLIAGVLPATTAAISNQGWIDVQSNVDGASVYFDGKYQGMTENGRLLVTVFMAIPVRTVTVEKTGYTTAGGTPEMPSAGETIGFYARLRPITTQQPSESSGSLSVDTSPGGAAIYLNGYFRGISPVSLNQVKPGSYTVEAVLKGYTTCTTLVRISPGRKTDLYCTLQSGPQLPNVVYITSDPTNVFVYLDTVYMGMTPFTLRNIGTGGHVIELNAPGYDNWNTRIHLPDGGVRTVHATMNATVPGGYSPQTAIVASPESPVSPTTTKSGSAPILLIAALGLMVFIVRNQAGGK